MLFAPAGESPGDKYIPNNQILIRVLPRILELGYLAWKHQIWSDYCDMKALVPNSNSLFSMSHYKQVDTKQTELY